MLCVRWSDSIFGIYVEVAKMVFSLISMTPSFITAIINCKREPKRAGEET